MLLQAWVGGWFSILLGSVVVFFFFMGLCRIGFYCEGLGGFCGGRELAVCRKRPKARVGSEARGF